MNRITWIAGAFALSLGALVPGQSAAAQPADPDPSVARAEMNGTWVGRMSTMHGNNDLNLIVVPEGSDTYTRVRFGLGGAEAWRDLEEFWVLGDLVRYQTTVGTNMGDALVTFEGTRTGNRIEGRFTTTIGAQEMGDGPWWVEKTESGAGVP